MSSSAAPPWPWTVTRISASSPTYTTKTGSSFSTTRRQADWPTRALRPRSFATIPSPTARRAAWQEFGDVLAEGLYALLHLDLGVQQATREYWTYFLEARRNFLEAINTRSRNAHPDIRADMLLSVQSALKCSLMIKPDLCARYIQLWRQDLADWKRRAAAIPRMPSIDAALREMRLLPPTQRRSTEKIRAPPR